MGTKKYKYYFRKPTSEISKDILNGLLAAGMITLGSTSPYFGQALINSINKLKKHPRKKVSDTFSNFRRQGLINIEKSNYQTYIYLTERGKHKANWMQIDELKIKNPKNWDGKWRIVIFDISQLKKAYREAFRGKLKELGFFPLQKSVWIHAFDCKPEIDLLRDFFNLSSKEMRLILAENIGKDQELKKRFNLN